MDVDDIGPLPPHVRLDRDELAVLIDAIRALIDGTSAHEPNRVHILTIAFVIAEAVERAEGGEQGGS